MHSQKNILVTGGAGFIGSNLVRYLIEETSHKVINVDRLTYAGNIESLAGLMDNPRHVLEQVDICDQEELRRIFSVHQPHLVIHLAAESHVDRSIDRPLDFIQTNVVGTAALLEISREYLDSLSGYGAEKFRFHHISTDEVFGELTHDEPPFTEETPYKPSSPYAASKASSDHLVRSWQKTFGLPVVITNCSNNYGPYQFPEKLIPLTILNALEGRPLPVYGSGDNVRDWLFVQDHVKAIYRVAIEGRIGGSYNIGARSERRNIDVVRAICRILDKVAPNRPARVQSYEDLITFVADRPGHDFRYSIDPTRIVSDLEWLPEESFETGLEKTVVWYMNNRDWCRRVQERGYNRERLGARTAS